MYMTSSCVSWPNPPARKAAMECRRASVGTETVWSCALEAAPHKPATHPLVAHHAPVCTVANGCCARHPRENACIAAVVEARNRAMLSKYAEFSEGAAPIRWATTAPLRVAMGLPSVDDKSEERPLLTLVQGFRQTVEYALQAAALSARHATWLVAASELLLHCNNAELPDATLLRFLARYPHRTRALIHSSDNSQGYRCGHLHAVATTRPIWAAYKLVLFAHPDVYLLPKAIRWLEAALAPPANQTRPPAFSVTTMYWYGASHAVPPPQAHMPPPVAGAKAGSDGRTAFFGTDLFAFAPPQLAADTWARVCTFAASEPPQHRLPEHALWRLVAAGRLTHKVLGNRTTSTDGEDAYGVWHSHEPERVAKYLVDHQLVRRRPAAA